MLKLIHPITKSALKRHCNALIILSVKAKILSNDNSQTNERRATRRKTRKCVKLWSWWEIDLPTLEEVRNSIKRLKNNKSPRSIVLPAELLKHGGEAFVPQEWNDSHYVLTHKKDEAYAEKVIRDYQTVQSVENRIKISSYLPAIERTGKQ